METTSFVPRLPNKSDAVSNGLMMVARVCLLVAIGLTPIFFIPGVVSLLGIAKVFMVLLLVLVAVVSMSLAILRSGAVTFRVVPVVAAWWGIVAAAFLSAVLSPSLVSSLVGDSLEIHTVAFLAILGLFMTTLVSAGITKKHIVFLYGALMLAALVLVSFHVVRMVFGADILAFGMFADPVSTLIGSFNDLGLFLGLITLVSLIVIVQLPLPRRGIMFAGVLIAASVFMLMAVNFFAIWLILALFSLMLLMYTLTKDRFGIAEDQVPHQVSKVSLGATGLIALVFTVSAIFLIGGTSLGAMMSKVTGMSYLEVRPSVTASLDIMRSVYAENAFTGTGPNRFVDAWQQYKDPAISETIFWDTPFNAGNGYIPSWFITTGIFGLVAWIVFLCVYFYTGIKMLVRGHASDEFWYFVGTTSFVAGTFVWLMSCIYVPGPAILIIGAISTGVMVIAYQMLLPRPQNVFNMLTTARTGFILIALVMVIIIAAIATGYGAMRQLVSAYTFATATANIAPDSTDVVEIVTGRIAKAYALYPTDTAARQIALYYMASLNALLSLPEASAAEQQTFQQTVTAGINAATEAVRMKPTDARNWKVLGDLYAVLSVVNIEGASARAEESYAQAERLDPRNPYYVLQKAVLAYRAENRVEARRLAALSLELKSNYTDALFLISQIDIADGDLPKAIATTEALIALESRNSGRYYQLGVLQSAAKNHEAAITAFSAALELDTNYANARYYRALQYLETGDTARAITELTIVRDQSPDNASVNTLIEQIKSGQVTSSTLNQTQSITEPQTVTTDNEVTTTTVSPESDLLTPVNTTPDAPVTTPAE